MKKKVKINDLQQDKTFEQGFKEFDRIENINKELLQALSDLYYSRSMPWMNKDARYKLDLELKLEH